MIETRKETPRVKEVFPIMSGLFSHANYSFPMDPGQMDLLFYTDFGLKTIAPLVEAILADDETLSSAKLTLLATMMVNKYKPKWDRDKAVAEAEYDPIHNYLDEYSEHKDEVKDEEDNRTRNLTTVNGLQESYSDTRTDNLSEHKTASDDRTVTESGADNRYGLNSSDPTGVTTDSASTVTDDDSSHTITNTGTQSTSGSDTRTINVTEGGTDQNTHDANNDYDREGYHRGNIGNISTQKLILEEIELWKWNFVDEILRDAAKFLTLPIYCLTD